MKSSVDEYFGYSHLWFFGPDLATLHSKRSFPVVLDGGTGFTLSMQF